MLLKLAIEYVQRIKVVRLIIELTSKFHRQSGNAECIRYFKTVDWSRCATFGRGTSAQVSSDIIELYFFQVK